MEIHLHVHMHHDEDVLAALRRIESGLSKVVQKEIQMSAELDALEASVARNTTVAASAVTLLQGLAAQISALKNDPVKLQALADSLKASDDDLAAAITANTPAAPPA